MMTLRFSIHMYCGVMSCINCGSNVTVVQCSWLSSKDPSGLKTKVLREKKMKFIIFLL